MKNWTITRQVLTGYLAALLATLLIVLIATVAVRQVSAAKDLVIDRDARLVAEAHRLDAAMMAQGLYLRDLVLTGDPIYRTRLDQARQDFDEALSFLRANAYTEEGHEQLARITALEEEREDPVAAVLALHAAGAPLEELVAAIGQELLPARDDLQAAVERFAEQELELIDVAQSEADRRARLTLLLIWLLGAGGVAFALLLAGWITRQVSRNVSELSTAVDKASRDVLAGTSQQVSGAAQQAASVQETVATVDEVAQSAEATAQRARSVAESTQQAAQTAETGTAAVEDSIKGMGGVREQVDSIAGGILALAERAQAISEIIKTVEDIADQTNLLALNASIEAARAGEQGKGFAVVAGEVRVLADQSSKATRKIADILGEIQDATNSAVMSTEAGTRSVTDGMSLVTEAGETIRALARAVSEASLASDQIVASAEQQAGATAQISDAMRSVNEVMDQNLDAARQAEETARELTGVAERLNRLVRAE